MLSSTTIAPPLPPEKLTLIPRALQWRPGPTGPPEPAARTSAAAAQSTGATPPTRPAPVTSALSEANNYGDYGGPANLATHTLFTVVPQPSAMSQEMRRMHQDYHRAMAAQGSNSLGADMGKSLTPNRLLDPEEGQVHVACTSVDCLAVRFAC